jgi:hypothetical protein
VWGGHSCPPTLTMSKKASIRPSTRHCAELRILVGRARHQAGALSDRTAQAGRPSDRDPIHRDSQAPFVQAARRRAEESRRIRLAHPDQRERCRGHVGADEKKAGAHKQSGFQTHLRIAAIGPATKKAIEQRGGKVDVVPKEYVAESVVRSLKNKVKGKRVLLVRAKIARDVIPHELRKAGAHVDVVEAYETVVPQTSRRRLRAALKNPGRGRTWSPSPVLRRCGTLWSCWAWRRKRAIGHSPEFEWPRLAQSLRRPCANSDCRWIFRRRSSPSRAGSGHRGCGGGLNRIVQFGTCQMTVRICTYRMVLIRKRKIIPSASNCNLQERRAPAENLRRAGRRQSDSPPARNRGLRSRKSLSRRCRRAS